MTRRTEDSKQQLVAAHADCAAALFDHNPPRPLTSRSFLTPMKRFLQLTLLAVATLTAASRSFAGPLVYQGSDGPLKG
jgi:hypothetical protein